MTEAKDRVYIHGGKYKGRFGTYMGKYGKVMCSIKIDGDSVSQRNLWLTSITRIQRDGTAEQERWNDSTERHSTSTKRGNDKTIEITDNDRLLNITKGEMLEVLDTIADMKSKIDALELKLRRLVTD
jgi:hypothetical protein